MSGMTHLLYRRKNLTPEQESEICRKCQFCCRWLGYRVAFDKNNGEYYKFINEWGVPLALEEGHMVHFFVPFPCQHIREGTGCNIYEDRPKVCRIHKGGDNNPTVIPYCGWYEPVSDEERYRALRSIEWNDPPDKSD